MDVLLTEDKVYRAVSKTVDVHVGKVFSSGQKSLELRAKVLALVSSLFNQS
jgi:hypothetical protein